MLAACLGALTFACVCVRGRPTRRPAVCAEQLEQLAAFFPDQFILPTDAWQWKLSWSKALPENAPPSSPAGARPRPSREVLGLSSIVLRPYLPDGMSHPISLLYV